MDISYVHFRLPKEAVSKKVKKGLPPPELLVPSSVLKQGGIQMSARGGVTLCHIVDGSLSTIGQATCSMSDGYKKKKGIALAKERALAKLAVMQKGASDAAEECGVSLDVIAALQAHGLIVVAYHDRRIYA